MASIRKHTRRDGLTSFYVLYRDKGVQTSKAFDDENEAKRFKAFLDANGNSLTAATRAARSAKGEGPTVAEQLLEHIAGLTGIEDRTRADYSRDARLHINGPLGAIKVKQLTRRRVREWVNELDKAGAAPKSVANWHGLLSAAMATAVEDLVRPDNPCRGVRLPEREHRNDKEKFLELEHYQLLLSRFDTQWQPVVQLLAGTGLRWSEATALSVGDVVLDAEVPFIVVDKAWKRTDSNTFYLGKPKTRRAIRDVTIDAGLAAVLERSVEGRSEEDFLIQNATRTGHLQYSNFQSRIWTPAVRDSGLRHRPVIHSLRHSHGSWLLAEGVDLMTVSRRLGHESIQTTINVYGHISARSERAAADAMGRALHGLSPT